MKLNIPTSRVLVTALAASTFGWAMPASATIDTVFNGVPDGVAQFNSTVTGAGGTPTTQTLAAGQTVYSDFTISHAPYGSYGTLSGSVVNIDPNGPDTDPRSDPLDYINSGITFNFTNPINSIGFEVGDWGTCCLPSGLYISFDGGSPIQVGLSTIYGDVFFGGRAEVFVAAFDDSGQFNSVSFWGDGVGEVLVAGGTVRYALLDGGTLPGGAVPEPATWALMLLGMAGTGFAMRRQRQTQKVRFAF